MARPETQKNLGGDVPEPVHQAISDWVDQHRNAKLRQVVTAMAELWLMLPEPMQAILLICKTDSPAWRQSAQEASASLLERHKDLCAATAHPEMAVRNALALASFYAYTSKWIKTGQDLFDALGLLSAILLWDDSPSPADARPADIETLARIQAALRDRMDPSSALNLAAEKAERAGDLVGQAKQRVQSRRSSQGRPPSKAAG